MADELRDTVQATTVIPDIDAAIGPALFANRFFVTMTPAGARIAFAETVFTDRPTAFRSAVVLAFQDAIELKKLLESMLKPIEDALAAQQVQETRKDG